MICPSCGHDTPYDPGNSTRVIDSRSAPNNTVRRRRKCRVCDHRFTTYERLGIAEIWAVTVVVDNWSGRTVHRNPFVALAIVRLFDEFRRLSYGPREEPTGGWWRCDWCPDRRGPRR